MNKREKIEKAIKENKELFKKIVNENYQGSEDLEIFIESAQDYIKAVKQGRILYTVLSVSSSGMSRQINIKSCEKNNNKHGQKYYYRNYYYFLKCLGYRFNKDRDGIIVSGCGMNMLFATNYDIIRSLYHLKFISKKQCEELSQAVN